MRILVIEDDVATAKLCQMSLSARGMVVDHVTTGEEGRVLALVNPYDAVILDLHLPDTHGLQLILELRRAGSRVPILVLTADDDTGTAVRVLDAGADDFITKPFRQEEFYARIRAAVRRAGSGSAESLQVGTLVLNRRTREAFVDTALMDLTVKELNLLEYFMQRVNDVVTRADLLEKLWDMNFDPGSNIVDVHVGRLRRKLDAIPGAPRFVTVRGAGYRLIDNRHGSMEATSPPG